MEMKEDAELLTCLLSCVQACNMQLDEVKTEKDKVQKALKEVKNEQQMEQTAR